MAYSLHGQAFLAEDTALLHTKKEIPTVDLNPNEIKEKEKKKKKKTKRKFFFNIKTKRFLIKDAKGRNTTYSTFHVLKVYQTPSTYLQKVYYYNKEKRQIETSSKYKPSAGMPLHGSYQKVLNGQVIEQGSYYIGGKTGRWEKYSKNGLLIDKKKYYRGFPKESIITYWDLQKTRIKELIPIHYGVKEGFYLSYYESGNVKEKGEYKDGIKIKSWWEYYDRKGRRNSKRETVYPRRPYDNTKPYVRKEWDKKGKKIIDVKK